LGILFFISFLILLNSATNDIKEKNANLEKLVGEKVVLGTDTLEIVDYSYW
jgi:hypothetical protein